MARMRSRARRPGRVGEARPTQARKRTKVVLLSGGNPQIAKADGDAPVQAYIAALPGWKRDLGKRLDALRAGGSGKELVVGLADAALRKKVAHVSGSVVGPFRPSAGEV